MSGPDPGQITQILGQISSGESNARDDLLPLVYEELRRMARFKMAREPKGATLQPTALVHEAYLRLLGDADSTWENRAHFFGAASEAMRRILVERARARLRLKRGGKREQVELQSNMAVSEPPPEEILALDETLDRLERKSSRLAQVVKLRYFAGLSIPDVARALDSSPRSVNRDWAAARAWLHKEMSGA